MHIGIVGPIATENVSPYMWDVKGSLPSGYAGAPLLGTLIGELLRRGHRVSAFTTSAGAPLSSRQWIAADGDRFRIHYCGMRPHSFRPKHGRLGRAMDMFAMERACLCNAIQDAAPDVIHAHWVYEFGLAAIKSGYPAVITCHDAPQVVLRYMPNLYRFVRYWMGRRCLDRAEHITVVSPYLQNKIQRYVRGLVEVVPNPLPFAITTKPIDIHGKWANMSKPVICMVLNGWGRRKNPQPALRAFQLLRRDFAGAELRLYGDDYGPGEIAEHWAKKRNLTGGVHFGGRLSHRLLLAEISKADVLLHPSLEETFGMSVAEAMSLAVPVVGGAKSGAVPWVIGGGGLVTDANSPQAIAKSLSMLVGDKVTYLRCATAAQIRVNDTFTVHAVVKSYEQLYQRAMGKNKKPIRHENITGQPIEIPQKFALKKRRHDETL